jgi:4-hydroxy-2-oxoheptanedioate aldolase
MTKSRVLRKLRAGEHVLSAAMTRLTDPWLAEVIGRIGYDNIWFDLEHRGFGMDRVDPVALACRAVGIDLMVRIRKGGYFDPMRALECGANGLMIPHIKSAEEARQYVEWCRFPPVGKRGLDGAGADADWGTVPRDEYLAHVAQEIFLVYQIEDPEAVEQIDEIAAVPGYDILFIGPGDLALSYGVACDLELPVMKAAYARVAAAAAKHGKWWGTTTATPAHAQTALDQGARFVIGGGDHGMLLNGFRSAFRDFNQIAIK